MSDFNADHFRMYTEECGMPPAPKWSNNMSEKEKEELAQWYLGFLVPYGQPPYHMVKTPEDFTYEMFKDYIFKLKTNPSGCDEGTTNSSKLAAIIKVSGLPESFPNDRKIKKKSSTKISVADVNKNKEQFLILASRNPAFKRQNELIEEVIDTKPLLVAKAVEDYKNSQLILPESLCFHRSKYSANHDKLIIDAMTKHGGRTAYLCGTIISKILQRNMHTYEHNCYNPVPLNEEVKKCNYGNMGIETCLFDSHLGDGLSMGVIVTFIKGCDMVMDVNFYVGKGAWYFVGWDKRPWGGEDNLFRFNTKSLCQLKPPAENLSTIAALKVDQNIMKDIQVLDEVTDFFVNEIQKIYLEPEECIYPKQKYNTSGLPPKFMSRCLNCAKVCPKFPKPLRCSRCRKATYCSKECQKSNWKQHKKVCLTPDAAAAKKLEKDLRFFSAIQNAY
eukprot:g4071.t1